MRQKEFSEQGYVILKKLLTPLELQNISQFVNPIYALWQHKNQSRIQKQELVNMHSLTHPEYFPPKETKTQKTQLHQGSRAQFFSALLPLTLTQSIEDIVGTGLYFHNTQLFFNPTASHKHPYWHRDLQFSPIPEETQAAEQIKLTSLHLRIPLIPETGLELIPGSHRRWDTPQEEWVRFEKNGHKNNEALPGSQLLSLTPGDVLLFDAQMLHRGAYKHNTQRKALDLCVGKPHFLTTPYLAPENLPTESELTEISNVSWYQAAYELSQSQ